MRWWKCLPEYNGWGRDGALLAVDIDHFKRINDTGEGRLCDDCVAGIISVKLILRMRNILSLP